MRYLDKELANVQGAEHFDCNPQALGVWEHRIILPRNVKVALIELPEPVPKAFPPLIAQPIENAQGLILLVAHMICLYVPHHKPICPFDMFGT